MENKFPKNVRQIGNVSDTPKIYVEDYVDTFLNQICDKADKEQAGAFLVGKKEVTEGQECLYIFGAICMEFSGDENEIISQENFEKAEQEKKEYFEEGLQQIRTAFGTYDHVILTDESIWHALSYSKKSLLQELKKEADKQQYQIKVIVYLRRQDGLLISRWNQEVKQNFNSAAVMTCEEYLAASEKKEKKIYQYAQKLDEIAAVIGKNNLIVRRFSPKSWKDGSIIHDFMHEIGLDVTEEFQELEESENLRLDKNTTEIKRILNKSEFLTEKEISYFRRFLKEISKDYIKEENTEMLAKEELQQFLELYAKENERVAEEYIGDGQPLFSNEVKDLPKWNPQNEKMQEEIIQFFAAVTMDLRRTNEIQRQKINQQEKRIRQLEKRANEFVMFRDKAKHPFRTVWKKVFR